MRIRFPVADQAPSNVTRLLQLVLETANRELPFEYRLDIDGEFFAFVPTRTHNAQGLTTEVTPLLDRLVTIPPGTRSLAESGRLMADSLSVKTGTPVSCCQTYVAGIPWGFSEVPFQTHDEPARKILERLIRLDQLTGKAHSRMYWIVRCDSGRCPIDLHGAWTGEWGPWQPAPRVAISVANTRLRQLLANWFKSVERVRLQGPEITASFSWWALEDLNL